MKLNIKLNYRYRKEDGALILDSSYKLKSPRKQSNIILKMPLDLGYEFGRILIAIKTKYPEEFKEIDLEKIPFKLASLFERGYINLLKDKENHDK